MKERIEYEKQNITIMNRYGNILYTKGQKERSSDILKKELNL